VVEGVQYGGGESIPHLRMLQDRTCVLLLWVPEVVCKQLTLELLEKPHLSTRQASLCSFRNWVSSHARELTQPCWHSLNTMKSSSFEPNLMVIIGLLSRFSVMVTTCVTAMLIQALNLTIPHMTDQDELFG